jgi:hypothetical protein
MRLRSAVAAHPVLLGSILLALGGLAAFVLAYFEPQKLFIDDRVNEPLPTLAATPSGEGDGNAERGRRPSPPDRIEVVASGSFQSYEHSTSGRARVLRLADGSRYLRFEGFETSNGPDLHVYLSAAPAGGEGDAFDDEYVELGELKGNIGPQNYPIAADVRLGDYRSAVVWCKRFSVAFAAAPLD